MDYTLTEIAEAARVTRRQAEYAEQSLRIAKKIKPKRRGGAWLYSPRDARAVMLRIRSAKKQLRRIKSGKR